jgi:hypothetical protein
MQEHSREASMDFRLEKLQQALSESLAGTSSEEMSWHPPGKWCAAEVLADA